MGRPDRLSGTAFVTGASKGLGLAFSQMLLGEGMRVWGTSRDASRLAGLSQAHPGAFTAVTLDLGDGAGAAGAYAGAEAAAGGEFDIVVNNAGFGLFGEFAAVEAAQWRRQLEAMLGTVLGISHASFRTMQARGRGALVHVSSLAAQFPIPFMSGYNVAKAGLSALSESLMFEARGTGIIVIDFRPGDYHTEFNQTMPPDTRSDVTRRARDEIERLFAHAPKPERAARDLRRALLAGRSGVVRSGAFFQARVAPLMARLGPEAWIRKINAGYYGYR
jgi:short-subunit dehydrogenase